VTIPAPIARERLKLIQVAKAPLRYQADAFVALGSALTIQVFLVVSGVVSARMLGVENRGFFAAFNLYPVVLAQLVSLGLPVAATYFVARNPDALAPVLKGVGRVLAPGALLAVILQLVLVLMTTLDTGLAIVVAGLATVPAVPGLLLQAYGLALLQGSRRMTLHAFARVVPVALCSAITLALFAAGSTSFPLVAAAWSLPLLVMGALTFGLGSRSRRRTAAISDEPSLSVLVRFGLKSLPSQLSPLETLRVDQFLVGIVAGAGGLGLYVAGQAFANLPRFIGQNIGFLAYPAVAARQDELVRTILTHGAYGLLCCGVTVLAIELASAPMIPLFFGAAFEPAIPLTRILVLASLFFALRKILVDCARGLERPELGLYSELTGLLAFVALSAVLALPYAETGIAYAVLGAAATGLASLVVMLGFTLLGLQTGKKAPAS
jgi:O-antigen/teichoic acid export membrane protein